ncbi:hypothetical protein C7T35_18665 [Variovorax sp. WS11]|uniref:hypothetical protein n=1 Tax=Variovorax sp. WS11 TaxID=1105204 RepID=UPI000D0D205E|nr:hypothetical protein [Variovorax sp. WS11]NDZ14979.1 hypothetical protein [Variovorax sp. WS11]PSL82996.1 hypothetical protein C7T35_18665 [Variovorax sp. WS11]
MKNSTSKIAILAMAPCALWASPAAAAGTAAWRCGNTYSDQPCPEGKPLALDDARDATQKRDADRTTREALAAGDRLERERLRQEKAQAGRHPTLIDSRPAAPKPEADSAKKKKKGKKEPDYFSAHDPVATAKKKAEKAEKAGRRSADKS